VRTKRSVPEFPSVTCVPQCLPLTVRNAQAPRRCLAVPVVTQARAGARGAEDAHLNGYDTLLSLGRIAVACIWCCGWQVPYCSYVETETYKQQPDGAVRIEQTIYVETEGQKKILVGMIKDLGTKSRSEMKKFLGCNVHLFLKVRFVALLLLQPCGNPLSM